MPPHDIFIPNSHHLATTRRNKHAIAVRPPEDKQYFRIAKPRTRHPALRNRSHQLRAEPKPKGREALREFSLTVLGQPDKEGEPAQL